MMKLLSWVKLLLLIFFPSLVIGQTLEYYISDAGNFNLPPWQILKFDENGENGVVFIKENLAWPQDILFLENDSQVLISNLNSGVINRHDAETGSFISVFAGGISGPTRIKIGPDGLLYVLQWSGNGKILRFNLDGSFVDEFTTAGVTQSIGLDWDVLGNLYVSSYNGGTITKFDKNGDSQGTFGSRLSGPTNIHFRPNGDLLVLDYTASNVKLFDSAGNPKGVFIGALGNPEGISVLSNSDIVIGNGTTSSVKLFDHNGVFKKELITSRSKNLLIPNAVVTRIKRTSSSVDITAMDAMVYAKGNNLYFLNKEYLDDVDSIHILDFSGKEIQKSADVQELILDASKFSSGMYIIQLNLNNGKSGTKKIIVNN